VFEFKPHPLTVLELPCKHRHNHCHIMSTLENFTSVQIAVDKARAEAGRNARDLTLVAVSKTYDAEHITPVLEQGHRVFGENRVQEAKQKWPPLRKLYSGIELHLIGPLQSNKAAEAVALFDVIQTIDRPKIAEAVAAEMRRQARSLKLFVQVNTGREPQKAGVMPEDLRAILELMQVTLGLTVEGLMCIPPVEEDASHHFAMLKQLAATHGLKNLSMGMSSDFAFAIAQGATHVRIGSAIFGARNYS
jgi:PLP dependent protein